MNETHPRGIQLTEEQERDVLDGRGFLSPDPHHVIDALNKGSAVEYEEDGVSVKPGQLFLSDTVLEVGSQLVAAINRLTAAVKRLNVKP